MKMITNYPMVDRIRSLEKFNTPKNHVLQILIFIAVFMAASIIQSVIVTIGIMPKLMKWTYELMESNGGSLDYDEAMKLVTEFMMDPSLTVLTLFSTLAITLTVFFYCRVFEGRKLSTIGLSKKGAFPQYLLGLGVGFAMFSAVVGISYLMGGLTANGLANGKISGILLAFVGFGIQGMSEEVLCRGYFMTTTLRHHKPWVAIVSNSIIFSVLHGANPGISLLALVNLFLCGVMFSLYVLRTDNLWGACALHSIWNFVQGNFFGLPVSGIDSGDSVFSFSLNEGMNLANGGTFGAEAGLPTTIVLSAVIAILLFVPFGKKQEAAA